MGLYIEHSKAGIERISINMKHLHINATMQHFHCLIQTLWISRVLKTTIHWSTAKEALQTQY